MIAIEPISACAVVFNRDLLIETHLRAGVFFPPCNEKTEVLGSDSEITVDEGGLNILGGQYGQGQFRVFFAFWEKVAEKTGCGAISRLPNSPVMRISSLEFANVTLGHGENPRRIRHPDRGEESPCNYRQFASLSKNDAHKGVKKTGAEMFFGDTLVALRKIQGFLTRKPERRKPRKKVFWDPLPLFRVFAISRFRDKK